MSSEIVDCFRQVTGADAETAVSFLSACNNNLDMAVSLYMDDPHSVPPSSTDEYRSPIPQRTEQLLPNVLPFYTSTTRSLSSRITRRAFVADDSDDEDGTTKHPIVVSSNGESEFHRTDDCVASSRDPSSNGQPQQHADHPHLQRSTSNETTRAGVNGAHGAPPNYTRKRGHLRQLFKPPTELLFKGSMSAAQIEAREKNQWLLISLHDEGCFDCHLLNRDVWKDTRVYQTVKRNFTFIQIAVDSPDGITYRTRHSYVSAASHIAIHDPVSGEQKVMWMHLKDPKTVNEALTGFLEHSQTVPVSSNSSSQTHMLTSPCSPSSSSSRRRPSTQMDTLQHNLDYPLKRLRLNYPTEDDCSLSFSGPSSVLSRHTEGPGGSQSTLQSETYTYHRSVLDSEDPFNLTEDEQLQLALRASQMDAQTESSSNIVPSAERSNRTNISEETPIILTDDDDSVDSDASDADQDCFIVDPDINPSTTTATISARRPLRPVIDDSKPSASVATYISTVSQKLPVPGPQEEAIELLVRFPSGSRECFRVPPTLTLLMLRKHFEHRGFPHSQYELIRLYPRRSLSALPDCTTLTDAGLCKADTVFIQER